MEMTRSTWVHLVVVVVALSGCTSISVQPVSDSHKISEICIEENPKVVVEEFLNVVRDGFDRHGIATRVIRGPIPADCSYVLHYTALKKWDMAVYMHHAELWLEHDGRKIGSATYHLRGSGGASLMKWQSTKTKMDPVIDELLGGIQRKST